MRVDAELDTQIFIILPLELRPEAIQRGARRRQPPVVVHELPKVPPGFQPIASVGVLEVFRSRQNIIHGHGSRIRNLEQRRLVKAHRDYLKCRRHARQARKRKEPQRLLVMPEHGLLAETPQLVRKVKLVRHRSACLDPRARASVTIVLTSTC